jgi:mycothiol synthase
MNHSSVIMRPYKGESDLQLLVELIDACERVDKLESSISIAQLQLEIEVPGVDLDRDLRLWEDSTGKLIGFSALFIAEPIEDNLADGTLWFIIHPIFRGSNVDQQMITWAENRLREVARERQGRPKLFTWSLSSRTERIAAIEHHGFVEDRHFFNLSRSLTEILPTPQLPQGFTIRPVNGEQDAQAWVDLHNQSFINTWNYHPLTVETYKHRLQDPEYLAELDLVAIDPNGKFAAACYCSIDRAHNTFIGRQEGWVGLLCTSPEFQRRGLARAMLYHGLARLKALKMDIAKIGVDSENPFGAKELYESVGFERFRTNTAYVKHL